MNNRQAGFTLLEVLIALTLFALLALATGRLLDVMLKAGQSTSSHAEAVRELQRAMRVIERDVLQLRQPARGSGVRLEQGWLNFERGGWSNPLGQPRSDLQQVTYVVDQGSLWRHSRGAPAIVQKQRLLHNVTRLQWRLFDPRRGWQDSWPAGLERAPAALELSFESAGYPDMRRIFLLPGARP